MKAILTLCLVSFLATTSAMAEVIEIPAKDMVLLRNPDDSGEAWAAMQFELPKRIQKKAITAAYLQCFLKVDTRYVNEPSEVTLRIRPLRGVWNAGDPKWERLQLVSDAKEEASWLSGPGAEEKVLIEVTNLVSDWTFLRKANHGLLLQAEGDVKGFEYQRDASGTIRNAVLRIWISNVTLDTP